METLNNINSLSADGTRLMMRIGIATDFGWFELKRKLIEALYVLGYELDEVLVSSKVPGDENDLVGFVILVAVRSTLFRYLEFHPDDSLDPFGLTGLIEFEHPVEVSGIGESDCRHSEFFRALRVYPSASAE